MILGWVMILVVHSLITSMMCIAVDTRMKVDIMISIFNVLFSDHTDKFQIAFKYKYSTLLALFSR